MAKRIMIIIWKWDLNIFWNKDESKRDSDLITYSVEDDDDAVIHCLWDREKEQNPETSEEKVKKIISILEEKIKSKIDKIDQVNLFIHKGVGLEKLNADEGWSRLFFGNGKGALYSKHGGFIGAKIIGKDKLNSEGKLENKYFDHVWSHSIKDDFENLFIKFRADSDYKGYSSLAAYIKNLGDKPPSDNFYALAGEKLKEKFEVKDFNVKDKQLVKETREFIIEWLND